MHVGLESICMCSCIGSCSESELPAGHPTGWHLPALILLDILLDVQISGSLMQQKRHSRATV